MKPTKTPRLSSKEHSVLTLMASQPSKEWYGLELVERSGGDIKRGTIYVTLQRMAEKGLVESHREAAIDEAVAIPRRLYKPTGLGSRALDAHNAYEALLTAGLAPA